MLCVWQRALVQVRLDNRVLKVVENRVVSALSKELLIETLQVSVLFSSSQSSQQLSINKVYKVHSDILFTSYHLSYIAVCYQYIRGLSVGVFFFSVCAGCGLVSAGSDHTACCVHAQRHSSSSSASWSRERRMPCYVSCEYFVYTYVFTSKIIMVCV